MKSFLLDKDLLKACKLFTAKKDPREFLKSIQVLVNAGNLYIQATDGHAAIRCLVERDIGIPDNYYGAYAPDTFSTAISLDTEALNCPQGERIHYPVNFEKVLPYTCPENAELIETRYKVNIEYLYTAWKAVKDQGLGYKFGHIIKFKSIPGKDEVYYFWSDKIAIAIMGMREQDEQTR
jgi:hypothetical protein